MKKYTFAQALDQSRAIFYDLTACKLRFNFRSLPDEKQLIFTAVENADLIKSKFAQFEIKLDSRQNRFAELIINYD